MRFDLARRLEPARPFSDLGRGFSAETADAVWFLARQWQIGEHRGEDAASPLRVTYRASHVPIDPLPARPGADPRVVPPEAIVESQAGEWWTPGRRLRIGIACAASLGPAAAADPALLFGPMAPPYDHFEGVAYDGRELHRQRAALNLSNSLFEGVPAADQTDLWDPAELTYEAEFTSGTVTLSMPRHGGGEVDWFSVRADSAVPDPAPLPDGVTLTPSRVRFPGAPHPRWWQIEDAQVDVGGTAPDRSHFATLLLIDLIASNSDDWFSFPVETETGCVVTLHEVEVRDSFDEDSTLTAPSDWSLFRVAGLAPTSLVVWPTVAAPLHSPLIDDVVVGVDEDANLLWAVEIRAEGRELAAPSAATPSSPAAGSARATDPVSYAYAASTRVPRFWHPYVIREVDGKRRFVQGSLADLTQRPPLPSPEPVSPLLYDPSADASGPVHQIEPAAVPSNGMRLQRRWVLGRRADGQPVLWAQRQRTPLLAPPTSGLRFDVMEEVLSGGG